MAQTKTTKQLSVAGMTCGRCETKIENTLRELEGVISAKASYNDAVVLVTYDESKVRLIQIKEAIASADYEVSDSVDESPQSGKLDYKKIAIIAVVLLGAFVAINQIGGFDLFSYFPQAKTTMSFAAIFIIGLLTSVHCVGMCGGICLSQCAFAKGESKIERMRPAFLYNAGRIISYTIIGGIVGAIGSVISFNGVMRGAVAIFAGVFMIIMGLNMLGAFSLLRKFNLRMPKFLTANIDGKAKTPFYVGLLNGIMPCGPLQAMQLYALSTGSAVRGAVSMLLFALGTSLLLFTFGAASSFLSKKFTKNMLAVSAILVIMLGFGMLNTGASMSGFLALGTEKSDAAVFEPKIIGGFQLVEIEVSPRGYGAITVVKDIPVKFNLHVQEGLLNGCNEAIIIPEYSIQAPLNVGDNIVQFTPTTVGTFPYSCWMNMIRSSITVLENGGEYDAMVQQEVPNMVAPDDC